MNIIDHNSAIILERKVRSLYNLPDRGMVSGLADADHFASHPMDAAIMVISYIYAKGLEDNDSQFEEFLCKYDLVFRGQNDSVDADEIKNYINDLNKIVNIYL